MARNFALHVDTKALEATGVALGDLSGGDVGKAIVSSLNEVVDGAYDLARKRMGAGINLSDDYLRRKMVVEHATNKKPEASVLAMGLDTPLSQFQVMQKVKPVNWSNSRIQGMGKKFGKWPGWTKRTGNQRIGIAVDSKSDGQSAMVTRGARSDFGHVFAIAGKKDNSGNLLVFSRKQGSDKMRTLLGPSVYQLFKYQLEGALMDETADTLAETLAEQIQTAIEKAIEK